MEAHDHDVRKDWISVVEAEDVGYLLNADSNREEVRLALVQGPEALALGQEHPIAALVEHRHQQLDTAEGAHLAEQEGVAGWACQWTDHCYEEVAGVP